MLGAAVAVTALALGCGTAAAVDAAAAETPTITRYTSDGSLSVPLVSGPDNALWAYEPAGGNAPGAFVRYGSSRQLSAVDAPADASWALTPLTPQADGGMALVASRWADRARRLPGLFRVDAGGRRVSMRTLPRSASAADAFALTSDGTVWYVDLCGDALYRWRPGEKAARVRLQPAQCSGAETASTLTVGPDGAVWFLNAPQGRVVRRDAAGRMRQWAFQPGHGTYSPSVVAADARGGALAFSDASPTATTGGWVTRSGRFVPSMLGAPAFGSDGRLWQAAEGRIVARSAGGRITSIELPGADVDPVQLAIARDGGLWFTTGRYEAPLSSASYYFDLSVATVKGEVLASWPLDASNPGRAAQYGDAPTPLTLGGDGALWTRATSGGGTTSIVRIVPPELNAPRKPAARVTGVLARRGRMVVVQVRCDAERGRFCRGTVRLGAAAKAVRWIAPGQSGTAVSLTLTRGAERRLRRRGALRTNAVVRPTGAGTTRKALTLRR